MHVHVVISLTINLQYIMCRYAFRSVSASKLGTYSIYLTSGATVYI